MTPTIFKIAAIVLVFGFTGLSRAEKRLATFTATASSRPTQQKVANTNTSIVCLIAVTNTGTGPQNMSTMGGASGNQFISVNADSTNFVSKYSSNPGNTLSAVRIPRTGATTPNADISVACGSGGSNTLETGETCLIRYFTFPVNFTEQIAICAGRLAVQDSGTTKGSVTASGNIYLNQETMVLGGILSGGLYTSGVSLKENTGVQYASVAPGHPNPEGTREGTAQDPMIANMNIYCSKACVADPDIAGSVVNKVAKCNALCGWDVKPDTTGSDPKIETAEQSSRALITNNAAKIWSGNSVIGVDKNYKKMNELFNEIKEKWNASTNTNNGGAATTIASIADINPQDPNPSMSVIQASPRYSGGVVQEMIVGAFTSICSGNKAYWDEGGTEFVEAPWTKTVASYPQRLLCSNRHAQHDLYMRTGQSVPFQILGGQPF